MDKKLHILGLVILGLLIVFGLFSYFNARAGNLGGISSLGVVYTILLVVVGLLFLFGISKLLFSSKK